MSYENKYIKRWINKQIHEGSGWRGYGLNYKMRTQYWENRGAEGQVSRLPITRAKTARESMGRIKSPGFPRGLISTGPAKMDSIKWQVLSKTMSWTNQVNSMFNQVSIAILSLRHCAEISPGSQKHWWASQPKRVGRRAGMALYLQWWIYWVILDSSTPHSRALPTYVHPAQKRQGNICSSVSPNVQSEIPIWTAFLAPLDFRGSITHIFPGTKKEAYMPYLNSLYI